MEIKTLFHQDKQTSITLNHCGKIYSLSICFTVTIIFHWVINGIQDSFIRHIKLKWNCRTSCGMLSDWQHCFVQRWKMLTGYRNSITFSWTLNISLAATAILNSSFCYSASSNPQNLYVSSAQLHSRCSFEQHEKSSTAVCTVYYDLLILLKLQITR